MQAQKEGSGKIHIFSCVASQKAIGKNMRQAIPVGKICGRQFLWKKYAAGNFCGKNMRQAIPAEKCAACNFYGKNMRQAISAEKSSDKNL